MTVKDLDLPKTFEVVPSESYAQVYSTQLNKRTLQEDEVLISEFTLNSVFLPDANRAKDVLTAVTECA